MLVVLHRDHVPTPRGWFCVVGHEEVEKTTPQFFAAPWRKKEKEKDWSLENLERLWRESGDSGPRKRNGNEQWRLQRLWVLVVYCDQSYWITTFLPLHQGSTEPPSQLFPCPWPPIYPVSAAVDSNLVLTICT